ncbi:hypothetical protein B0H15DRAFT_848633 [Mycena belliarum]|uniref:MADS-box domain-containing protein n=1 Tax=Mycena belliarum TaxID=1033014 RepID=A0AAD6U0Z5_9AGAR|nr:hypothetical protein B0H15DRAFT_848633 [Mycena belliae]
MGRRKIEIQPITHERNRSVTFLKRKNGLFKKAYELGVLCSVDVAVIIFEQRPGHNVKLYQYCSADAQDIVQRHVRFDGEKDTRGPADFSGAAAVKVDETVEGDEDEPDDDDDLPTLGSKRRNDGSKPGGDLPLSIDVDYRARQQPRPTSSSALPLSSDRTSPASKKARIAPMLPPGRTGASDSPGGFSYTPSMRGAGGGQGYNTPYYPPLSSQTPFAPSFESFAAGARGQGSRAGYPEYPLGASSRGAGQRGAGAGVGDPFGGLLDDDARQQHGMGGAGPVFNWPVHTGSSAGGMRRTCRVLSPGTRLDC